MYVLRYYVLLALRQESGLRYYVLRLQMFHLRFHLGFACALLRSREHRRLKRLHDNLDKQAPRALLVEACRGKVLEAAHGQFVLHVASHRNNSISRFWERSAFSGSHSAPSWSSQR